MLKKSKQLGFTLIELLVVIAIIGVLASIILVSLNSARNKGNDAKTKTNLSNLRTAAAVYYDKNNSYGTVSDLCTAGMFADPEVAPLLADSSYTGTVTRSCHATATGFSVSASLQSVTGQFWCVDYLGYAQQNVAAQGAGDVTCN
ncbi:hypothetical protein A2833_01450 [Candidatus Azambacteria bacterium RIFCSPHIGHO2_01_FULL_44_55]|uniref:Type II secretion system protein GspG C-terminal domain-containing protein n=1 Tax=Candidatus Azambacteria bacterium RIFCSPLOWO2_02_FULL_44_14 TaxID=1797306 RepID=A0A1F5CB01_9BACT|nr:MAG: hypothetical protein A3A18_01715 [Candidatus Azambacteria bacterium RIFCSPLOWO2_01_FULL_44_84]OGD33532.1 MAG: hypothetical protein A3C78_02340 [Candidatus Azambacteria bacterium RIFCSPHIGHO2_02_FULL_45_18]OGD40023.1 MAG: hypothetical protein A3I30_00220 [Candidatus Azambacteria bacterium RIFCSPLOWO2_02_FULL_44_14]OGD41642.1 MAG: hypothetical protein A2833_01450 [Candidatus Azambacteria bacterium RIFCSPHIGHO2_01_FULL_44_55]OGD49596.1 MAG: hypothetical protein A2608_03630 [Candidatus Azam